MSGTSADAIDAALVSADSNHFRVVSAVQHALPPTIREQIKALFEPSENEIDRMGSLDKELGRLFTEAVAQLLSASGHSAVQIEAIGSHGQTIRHRPRLATGHNFTLQIGDPITIAELTGITTVADFRRRDMAVGGQGAPLVPAFHRAVFHVPGRHRIILNIGGIANNTVIAPDGSVRGFDTGPGNGLMDAWIFHCKGEYIDRGGFWATSGQVSDALFQKLFAHPYFQLAAPKSTGREEFSPAWLLNVLREFPGLPTEDIQATILELTARSIAAEIEAICASAEVLVCGGGAHNSALMQRLAALLPSFQVSTTEAAGVPVNYVEAAAFAWLAMRTLNGLSGNMTAVTGANREAVLGGIYPGANWPGLRLIASNIKDQLDERSDGK